MLFNVILPVLVVTGILTLAFWKLNPKSKTVEIVLARFDNLAKQLEEAVVHHTTQVEHHAAKLVTETHAKARAEKALNNIKEIF